MHVFTASEFNYCQHEVDAVVNGQKKVGCSFETMVMWRCSFIICGKARTLRSRSHRVVEWSSWRMRQEAVDMW